MIAAVQSGEVTADRVIENIKKRGALKEKKSSGAKPRKKRREWSIFKCMNLMKMMKMMKRNRKRKRRQVMIGIRERRKLLKTQSCPNLPRNCTIGEESIAIPMKIKKSMKQHHHHRR